MNTETSTPVVLPAQWMQLSGKIERKRAPEPDKIIIKMMGTDCHVDSGVQEEKCLPLPDGYMFPTKGPAKDVMTRVIMGLAAGRNMFIWGMPGTGKDAGVHAYSAMTRRPCVMVTFRPGTDLGPWFYVRSLSKEGSGWEYGHLWRALTEGVLGRDGERRAPMFLLSDVDRADAAQAEWFRILTDSISGRILSPSGEMVPLFRDRWGRKPQFVCTANSCGAGDSRGRMSSSNPVDASIMDRLGRKIEAAYLDWDDEEKVLRAKYPEAAHRCDPLFAQLGKACDSIRKSIASEDLYGELTHRGLCDVMDEVTDLLRSSPDQIPGKILAKAFRSWTDGLDGDNRLVANRLIDAVVPGGSL